MLKESPAAGSLFMTAYSGQAPSIEFLKFLDKNCLAGIVLFADNCQNHAALKDSILSIQEHSENRALIAIDQEGGRVSRLRGSPVEYRSAAEYAALAEGGPEALQRALEVYEKEFTAAAQYLADLGVNFLLGPVCDLKLWNGETALESRTFGSDPEVASEFVKTTVRICREHGLACCLKHAPGLGRVSADPHEKLGVSAMSLEQFENVDSLPFKAGVAAGADSLMSSHFLAPEFDDIPVTLLNPGTWRKSPSPDPLHRSGRSGGKPLPRWGRKRRESEPRPRTPGLRIASPVSPFPGVPEDPRTC